MTAREAALEHVIEAHDHMVRAARLVTGSRLYDIIDAQLNDLASIESLLIPDDLRREARGVKHELVVSHGH